MNFRVHNLLYLMKILTSTLHQLTGCWGSSLKNKIKILKYCFNRQTDRHLYIIIKLRVVPPEAKSTLLSIGALSTKYTNYNADIL